MTRRINPLLDRPAKTEKETAAETAALPGAPGPVQIVDVLCGLANSSRKIRAVADLNNRVVIPVLKNN